MAAAGRRRRPWPAAGNSGSRRRRHRPRRRRPEAADEAAAARVAAAVAMATEDEAAEEGAAAAARPLDSFARALLEAVVHSPRWLPDAEVRACQTCAATFGNVTQRRHHCRHCGRVLCSSCSRDRCAIPKFGISRLVRVCGDCSIVLASAAAAAAEDNAEQTMRELRTGQRPGRQDLWPRRLVALRRRLGVRPRQRHAVLVDVVGEQPG